MAVLLPGLALAQTPDGRQIALHGNGNGALPCAACHGVNGQGNASIGAPRLAGLPAAVIVGALQGFAKGDGGNAMMQSIARGLCAAEMRAAGGYFSKL